MSFFEFFIWEKTILCVYADNQSILELVLSFIAYADKKLTVSETIQNFYLSLSSTLTFYAWRTTQRVFR